jgi:hypothetical protein
VRCRGAHYAEVFVAGIALASELLRDGTVRISGPTGTKVIAQSQKGTMFNGEPVDCL